MKHTRVRQLVQSAVAGAAVGALLVFLILVLLGSRREYPEESSAGVPLARTRVPEEQTEKPPSPSTIESPSPRATGTPAPASSALRVSPLPASRTENLVSVPEGEFAFALPAGYRVATRITRLERSQVPGHVTMTLTRGSEDEEAKFVALIEQLRQDQTATEAPLFLPGKTITVSFGDPDTQHSDAQLARAAETLTTRRGLSGTRYRRVEGLFTYDSVYVRLKGESVVAIQMGYASEEPYLDERAFMGIVNSLRDHASDERPAGET